MGRKRTGSIVYRPSKGWCALVTLAMAASCGGSTTKCDVECPAGTLLASSGCICIGGDASGSSLDASYADVVAGGLVLTGCPVDKNTSPFPVDMAHGGVPPTGSCDPGTTCMVTTDEQCAGGFPGGSSQWSCTCAAGSWSCTKTGQSLGICPPAVQCDGSICNPDEYCTTFGRCCPAGELCMVVVDAGGE